MFNLLLLYIERYIESIVLLTYEPTCNINMIDVIVVITCVLIEIIDVLLLSNVYTHFIIHYR